MNIILSLVRVAKTESIDLRAIREQDVLHIDHCFARVERMMQNAHQNSCHFFVVPMIVCFARSYLSIPGGATYSIFGQGLQLVAISIEEKMSLLILSESSRA